MNARNWLKEVVAVSNHAAKPRWVPSFFWRSPAQRLMMLNDIFLPISVEKQPIEGGDQKKIS